MLWCWRVVVLVAVLLSSVWCDGVLVCAIGLVQVASVNLIVDAMVQM